MKRKFAETFHDQKFQKLFSAMPEDDRKKLDEYCKEILGIGVDELKMPQQNSTRAKDVETDNIIKFQNVLKVLRNNNQDFKALSVKQILSIFTDAAKAEYYTNAPSGEPKLPLDGSGNSISDEQAKLMRRFSVEFQKECKNQGLTFSKTAKDNVNKNGMRTKSVVDFAKQNNIKLNDIFQAIWR